MRRMRFLATILLMLGGATPLAAPAQDTDQVPADTAQRDQVDEPPGVVIQVPDLVLTGIGFDVVVSGADARLNEDAVADLSVRVDGEPVPVEISEGDDGFNLTAPGVELPAGGVSSIDVVRGADVVARAETRSVPGWLSILPPLLAIVIALAFKRVVPALFLGVWVGAWIAAGLSAGGLFAGLLAAFETYVLGALADADHAAIILFSLMIGGMVGIISKNGGTQGIVEKIVGWASTAQRGQLATGLLGLAIFFDDYANTLVVGNTMRPVTDRLRVSREKLAYIVDSTAAPVACLAFVTTWIGYEVGLVGTAVAGIEGFDMSAYSIFLSSIPYSFYPILAIFFVFVIANTSREFGPMYAAEARARTTGQVLAPGAKVDEAAIDGDEMAPKADAPLRAVNAVLPVSVLVISVLAGLYVTGSAATGPGAGLRDIIGEANSYTALLWGSLLGVLTAAVLSIGQRILTLEETVDAWYAGLKAMLFAMIILVLAWALSDITGVLHTADFLISVLGDTVPAGAVPAIIFVLAAATAFATGSSWGTMGILMPLVVPLAWAVLQANDMADPEHFHVIYSTVSCVLAGSVWGDHCSPISDTTILSSMASGCDHIDHVRTQLPYAGMVGLVALFLGTLPAGFGVPWWACLIAGVIALSGGYRLFGKRLPDGETTGGASPAEAHA